ncbi:uncharacterized protein N7443_008646 [Penicillium atrosanguineum]|uniref:Tautomerase cis-CaaD-like domain-containing protein n=1 Tax=Penicillium atrosanguineum TaxID=1132637 RepID=A0A9W9U0G6_9EURO|nr:uncharacterized protein N7443_008646 [Penicillium atrosanguineum]KAJ5125578.1 hypothetical protein N7526_007755 [Penicillium atrosanguineum]KAJ5292693.1 hypothetical protein N7443_008646 [Penicillium atrosanguineum]KAJ5303282.1 hypothetical protein N7476_010081 [Penicillium atrosanguineum]
MPLWQIYHPAGTFEDLASKEAFAKDITEFYTQLGLPAFYVVVNFVPVPTGEVFVGGKVPTGRPFIRIVITHIAIHAPNEDAAYRRTTSRIDNVLKPHIADKGYDWEYHVGETERRLWKVNGLIPPPWKSEQEQIWVKENRAVPYDEGY